MYGIADLDRMLGIIANYEARQCSRSHQAGYSPSSRDLAFDGGGALRCNYRYQRLGREMRDGWVRCSHVKLVGHH